MSIKKFLRERAKKVELINDVKKVILDESTDRVSGYKKYGLETTDDFIQFFMNLENMVFYSGDTEIMKKYLDSLFELKKAGIVDGIKVLGRVKYYGIREVSSYNIDTFMIFLKSFYNHICDLSDVFYVNSCLNLLRELAQKSISSSFEEGLAELVETIVRLSDHFVEREMLVNHFYLKNVIISLVQSYMQKTGRSSDLVCHRIEPIVDVNEFLTPSYRVEDKSSTII